MAETYYEKILSLKEQDDFVNIVNKWKIFSDNIRKAPIDTSVVMPDMFWIAKSGSGKTYMLNMLAEFLAERENLIDFYGKCKFFEFLLGYCAPETSFSEIKRFMDEVTESAGFRSEFRGVVCIDVSEWIGHCEEKHFLSFLEFISAHSDKWVVVLLINEDESEDSKKLEAVVSMYLRIEKINIKMPSTEIFMEYIESFLRGYGISVAADAHSVLSQSVEQLRGNKYFDGYKTIKMISNELLYHSFSNKAERDLVIDLIDVEEFSYDSDFVKRIMINCENKRKIGFSGEGV